MEVHISCKENLSSIIKPIKLFKLKIEVINN